MKKAFLILALIPLILYSSCSKTGDKIQSVNSIIGDKSFIEKFGLEPDKNTNENLRIQTHLEYVEDLLRHRNTTELSLALQQKRKKLLDLLHDYWTSGVFPRNFDYKQNRVPCFIDKDNRICAVGYLIVKTSGREVAEAINSKHKYKELLTMNDNVVDNWIGKSGLSKEECAMIQPTYGPDPRYQNNYNYIPTAYGISSSIASGLNVSLNAINGIQLIKGTNSKTVGVLGLVAGAGQTILGIAGFPKTQMNSNYGANTTNESKKAVSMINIGLGTTTMILSAWNLLNNKRPTPKKITWYINGFETPDNNLGMAVTLCRNF